jgi:glyoxylase-like metal-dependent hydrolase (beta-lactamase superfamily II)
MNYEVLPVGAYEANCSVLWLDPAQAWVVDPGADADAVLAFMDARGLKAGIVVLTHGHFDHVSAVNEVLARFPVPVYLHKADAAFAFSPLNTMPPYPTTSKPATLHTDKADGDTLSCGGLSAKIICTPGHTPGGWCLYFEDEKLLIAGDTLFAGSVGRTDFPGGSWKALEASLQRLVALPDDTRVICGHGPTTTLGVEKRSNPYLHGSAGAWE